MALNRDTEITYLGHATLLIRTPGGKRVMVDAWTAGNPSCPEEFRSVESLGKLDVLLITHIHSDHVGDAEAIIGANPEADIVGVFEACNWIGGNVHPMNVGGTQTVRGIDVTMTFAVHSSSFAEADGTVVYGGVPVGYVLKLENGFTIYVSGDTAVFGDMALIRDLYHPDLAILPIGDHFTMGPREAALAVKLLGVKHVLPVHYGTFPVLTGTPRALAECTADIPGLEIHSIRPGETLR